MTASAHRVFVYGTLLPGEHWWHVVEPWVIGAEAATCTGSLWDTGAGYPAARFDDDGTIHGAVLDLLPGRVAEALAELDTFEDEYRRVEVETDRGRAWAYEWDQSFDSLRLIPSGRFAPRP